MHAGIESIDSMDGLVAALQRLRVEAGNPSYGEVAQRIGRMRAARGLPEQVAAPSKSTVYEAFKLGRIRIDAQLVEDIAAALGLVGAEPKAWRDTARRISNSGPLHLPEIDELTELSTNERLIGRTEEIAAVRSALQTCAGGRDRRTSGDGQVGTCESCRPRRHVRPRRGLVGLASRTFSLD